MENLSDSELLKVLISNKISLPPKTIHLEKNSITDITQRYVNTNWNIAEMYHENSKLSRYNIEAILSNSRSKSFITKFVNGVRSVSQLEKASCKYGLNMENPILYNILNIFKSIENINLLYSIELYILIRKSQSLLCFDNSSKSLYLDRNLSDSQIKDFSEGFNYENPGNSDFCICIIGVFIRNMLLFGIRGYRKTLVEAGRIGQHIIDKLKEKGIESKMITEFFDRDLDRILECDGIERSIISSIWI